MAGADCFACNRCIHCPALLALTRCLQSCRQGGSKGPGNVQGRKAVTHRASTTAVMQLCCWPDEASWRERKCWLAVLSTTYLSGCLLVQFPPTLSHSCFVEMLLLLACCIIKGGLQVGS